MCAVRVRFIDAERRIDELSSNYVLVCCVRFCINVLGKGMNPYFSSFGDRLNGTLDFLALHIGQSMRKKSNHKLIFLPKKT